MVDARRQMDPGFLYMGFLFGQPWASVFRACSVKKKRVTYFGKQRDCDFPLLQLNLTLMCIPARVILLKVMYKQREEREVVKGMGYFRTASSTLYSL